MWQQLLVNGLISAATYLLLAVSFVLIFRVSRFFHFAHAVVFTWGAYFAFLLTTWLSLPLFVSIVLAIPLSTALGCLMESFIYCPLRHKGASPLILLLSSLGMYIILQNVISIMFGDDTKSIRFRPVEEGLSALGAKITPIQILTICVCVILVAAVVLLLKKTKIGRAMRATASNAELAKVSGIDTDGTILWSFALGSAVAGATGILVALDVDMIPTMGMNALMVGIVVVIIGGVNSIMGVTLGAFLLGMAQHLGVWYISSQWQDAIAFVILLAFLVIKPEGFMGKPIRKATV